MKTRDINTYETCASLEAMQQQALTRAIGYRMTGHDDDHKTARQWDAIAMHLGVVVALLHIVP